MDCTICLHGSSRGRGVSASQVMTNAARAISFRAEATIMAYVVATLAVVGVRG